jgi:hypothetical protein
MATAQIEKAESDAEFRSRWLRVLVRHPPARLGISTWILEMRPTGEVMLTDSPVEVQGVDLVAEIAGLKARIAALEGGRGK